MEQKQTKCDDDYDPAHSGITSNDNDSDLCKQDLYAVMGFCHFMINESGFNSDWSIYIEIGGDDVGGDLAMTKKTCVDILEAKGLFKIKIVFFFLKRLFLTEKYISKMMKILKNKTDMPEIICKLISDMGTEMNLENILTYTVCSIFHSRP